jgi:hypothetical protein
MMMMMSSFTRIIGTTHCNYVLLLLLLLVLLLVILLLIKDSKILRIVKRSFVFFFVFEEVSFSLGTAVPLFDVDVPSALDEPFDDSY